MVIRFCPGKLGAKPDALTRCWDVYRKGGNSDFALANLSNFRPVFTQEQLSASLRATYFATPIIHSAVIMDIEKLHNDIRSSLPLDPISAAQLPSPSNSNGLLMKVVSFDKMTEYLCQMSWTTRSYPRRTCRAEQNSRSSTTRLLLA